MGRSPPRRREKSSRAALADLDLVVEQAAIVRQQLTAEGIVEAKGWRKVAAQIALIVELPHENQAKRARRSFEALGPFGDKGVVGPIEHIRQAVELIAFEVWHRIEVAVNQGGHAGRRSSNVSRRIG